VSDLPGGGGGHYKAERQMNNGVTWLLGPSGVGTEGPEKETKAAKALFERKGYVYRGSKIMVPAEKIFSLGYAIGMNGKGNGPKSIKEMAKTNILN